MKRVRLEESSGMSPGITTEGFLDQCEEDGTNGLENDTSHVIVAGAGPAGLMLACNLIRFGIKTTIVDDRPDKTSTGRADGLQPKTIETFKQLGLAGSLLQKGVRIYDICFWNATTTSPLHRTGREIHYPPSIVDLEDPFILLVHQGMVENVFIEDMQLHGMEVLRNSSFIRYSQGANSEIEVVIDDLKSGKTKILETQYLVGCDGARSNVRKSMPTAEMVGEPGKAAWGVLDGVIETDFPDLWSKVVISSEAAGTILCIPRERNMTRLYIELHPSTAPDASSEAATEEFVMKRAKEIISPFTLSWKTVGQSRLTPFRAPYLTDLTEWFGVYKVGQRVAKRFSDDIQKIFIAGDAAHTHSPKAAQGMNVSMHDAFNLAWKLNLSVRGLAKPSLLETYSQERKKIAEDLIDFDYEHANAFSAGDPKALAQNFAKNIRFISGVGAEYGENALNIHEMGGPKGGLRAGALLLPAKVERYIDANPVDLQLDIPMLGQFRIFFFTPDVKSASSFLKTVCGGITSSRTVLGRSSAAAEISYAKLAPNKTAMDEFIQPQRYTAVSKIVTYALVTTMAKADVEIADLPKVMQDSRWTFYVDSVMKKPNCTEKWLGSVKEMEVVIVNVRPDGYVGSIGRWDASKVGAGDEAARWLDGYYGEFLNA